MTFSLGYYLYLFRRFIYTGFRLIETLIILRVLLSWFSVNPYNPIINFIYRTTESFLEPIRRRMPDTGVLDLSPLVAFFLLSLLERLVNMIFWRLSTLL